MEAGLDAISEDQLSAPSGRELRRLRFIVTRKAIHIQHAWVVFVRDKQVYALGIGDDPKSRRIDRFTHGKGERHSFESRRALVPQENRMLAEEEEIGTLTFAPGVTTQPVNVTVNGDAKNEANETLTVNLNGPVNATIADGQGIGTIVNDDAVPTLSINDVAVAEGNAGTSAPAGEEKTVNPGRYPDLQVRAPSVVVAKPMMLSVAML